jgi:hypothetical protein
MNRREPIKSDEIGVTTRKPKKEQGVLGSSLTRFYVILEFMRVRFTALFK